MKRYQGRMRKNVMGKRVIAWMLTLVMVLSLVMVPAGEVQAAESVTVNNATDSSQDVYVKMTVEQTIAPNSNEAGNWPSTELTQYKVSIVNNTDTTISDWKVTISCVEAFNSTTYNAGWNGAPASVSGKDIVVTTYKGTDKDTGEVWDNATIEAGDTLDTGAGFQVATSSMANATYTLTYNVGESSGNIGQDDTQTDPSQIGITDNKVTATVTEASQSYDYYQYEIAVNNGLNETLSDWIVVIPATGITSSSAWDGNWAKVTWSYDSNYVYVTSNCGETISPGKSLGGESYKIQYSGSSALSVSEAKVYYKTGSSSTGAFDAVISNGTQPSGGSGGTGGGSTGGEIFDGSNIGTIDTSLDYNFAKLLQYSLYFYDANMCGDQVSETSLYSKDLYNGWRGDCHVNDKFTYNGKTYSAVGGYHDAGDHVKFGLPMSQAMTALGMGYYEFGEAFDELGQKNHLKTITDYYCTYVKSCTVLNSAGTQAEAFCYQVGHGDKDHASWVAPEVENESATERTYTLVASASNPATDIVSGTAAALTLNYLNFGNEEDLKYAKALFAFAKNNAKAVADYQGGFYHSSGAAWQDEYCLAAALLYRATQDSAYATEYTSNDANNGNIEKPYGWENAYQAAVLYAPDSSSNKTSHTQTIKNWFNSTANSNSNQYYAGDGWGSARVNCNVQFMMMVSDNHAGTNTYSSWCRYQMSQILGNNSIGKNLVCGYNTNSPTKPHHRAASGYSGWDGGFNSNAEQKYTLYGALCGGPKTSDFSTYVDSVNDAVTNEVALDYNACLVGSAAALYLLYKDSTDEGFSNQTINADFYGGSNFTPVGGTADPVTGISLDKSTLDLKKGETVLLTATVETSDESTAEVTWRSSDEDVATVDANGKITAIASGTAIITAQAGSKKATCEITVTTAVTGVSLNKTALTLEKSDTETLIATVAPLDASNKKVTWSSDKEAVVTVDATGKVTAVAGGTATITVTTEDGAKKATCTVTVTEPANLVCHAGSLTCPSLTYGYTSVSSASANVTNTGGIATTPTSVEFESGDNFMFVQKPTSSINPDTYAAIEVIPKLGLAAGTYTDKVIITYDGKTLEILVSVTVAKRPITIKANDATMTYGDKLPVLSVDSSYESNLVAGDSLSYQISTLATSTSDVGPYPIRLTVASHPNYEVDVDNGTLTVKPKVVNQVNYPTASALKLGQTLSESDLTGGSEQYGSFAWKDSSVTPTKGTSYYDVVLTLNSNAVKNYSFVDIEGYDSSAGTITRKVSVNVTRADLPDVEFPTAKGIEYGQSLEDSSFVGGSTTYGTFAWENKAYQPTVSDVAIGEIQAKVIFTWSETYKTQYELDEDEMTLEQMVTVRVRKQENGEYAATPVLMNRTSNSIVVTAIEGVEYSMDQMNWQTSGTFTGLTPFTSYEIYARYAETATQYPGEICVVPLQVYTLVEDPYTIDVSMFAGDKALAYADALRTELGIETVAYDTAEKILTLIDTDNTYTITGNNSDIVITTPNGTDTNIVLDNTTIRQLDVTKQNAASDDVVEICIDGTVQVDEIVSDSDNDVVISGTGILSVTSIEVAGALEIDGPTVNADATGTNDEAISAGEVVIGDSTVTANGGEQAPAITGGNITIRDSKVTATGGKGASAIEVTDANGKLTIKDAELEVNSGEGADKSPISADNIVLSGDNQVSSDNDLDNIYSSVPKDENGNEIAIYTVLLYEEDGKTQMLKASFYKGSQFTLPDIERQDGCIILWKEKTTGKTYEPKITIAIESDMTFVVSVEKIKVSKITLDSTVETITVGDGVALAESVEPSNAYDISVTWTSSNPSVASVDQNGQVTGLAAGVTVITVTANDGSGKSASCTVTVVEGEPEEVAVEKIKITGATKKVAPGKKISLKATVYPNNATNTKVKWKVNNTKYASVNSKGVVITKKAGKGKKVTVTAYSVEDNSIKATYKISIMKNPVKKIKLSAKTKTIKKGKSVTVKATFTPVKGISKELTWTSSNKKIATVNSKGKVTGKKKGTVKITAKAKDGSGKKATIKIRVK